MKNKIDFEDLDKFFIIPAERPYNISLRELRNDISLIYELCLRERDSKKLREYRGQILSCFVIIKGIYREELKWISGLEKQIKKMLPRK